MAAPTLQVAPEPEPPEHSSEQLLATSVDPVSQKPRKPNEPSASAPDWSREACERFWEPSKQLIRVLRDYSRARERGGPIGRVQAKWAVVRYRFWSAITGADIPLNTRNIAGGFVLKHANGVVLHPDVVIGPNCILFQQVTLGTGPKPGVPRLGGRVDVGPGAKILGGVVIGDHAVIGANAVVLSDVPAGAVAVGVPAVIRKAAAGNGETHAGLPADEPPESGFF